MSATTGNDFRSQVAYDVELPSCSVGLPSSYVSMSNAGVVGFAANIVTWAFTGIIETVTCQVIQQMGLYTDTEASPYSLLQKLFTPCNSNTNPYSNTGEPACDD